MFKLLNIDNKHPLVIRIESRTNDSIELGLKSIKAKRNKEELAGDRQYDLVNAYLDYKGAEFKDKLFQLLELANFKIDEIIYMEGLPNTPKPSIDAILNMFDIADVLYFVKDIYKVVPPPNLQTSFDEQIEADGLGTRVQTYITQDYYELAAITIPIKVIFGLLAKYTTIKESSIAVIHKEYVLYELFLQHEIFNHPAITKIREWCKILITAAIPDSDTTAITVIEKRIPSDDLPEYILAVVMLQKLSVAAIVTDSRERNIITGVYNYIINKLRPKADAKTKVRDKKPLSDTDSNAADKESIIESYRVVSNLTIGTEVELNWYSDNINLLIRDYGLSVDMAMLGDVLEHNKCFNIVPISKEQIVIIGYLFKKIIDPRALDYINISGIINYISLGFVVLWSNGYRELAMLLTAKPAVDDIDVIAINTTVNSVRLDSVIKSKLEELYPYQKQVNKVKTVSLVEESISMLANDMFKRKWLPNAPQYCLDELYRNKTPKLLPPNLKTLLGNLIIDIEENFNAATTTTS